MRDKRMTSDLIDKKYWLLLIYSQLKQFQSWGTEQLPLLLSSGQMKSLPKPARF